MSNIYNNNFIFILLLLSIFYYYPIDAVVIEQQQPLYAESISQCPKLVSSPRRQQPTNIHDLRPDDIKAVAAIGDR